MPLKINTPIEIVTRNAVEADIFKITQFTVNIEADTCHVIYKYGKSQPSGDAIWLGQDGFDCVVSEYSGGVYPQIKAKLYQAGIDDGQFPKGIIS